MPSVDDIVKAESGGFFSGVAPQFSAFLADPGGVAVLQQHLDCAIVLHDITYFGTSYDKAMALYAAHTMALAFPQAAQGGSGSGTGAAALSKKADSLSITYAAGGAGSGGGGTTDHLDDTPWGRQFKGVRRGRRHHPRYVSGA